MQELFLVLPLPISINKLYQNQARYNPKTKKYDPTGARIMSQEGKGRKLRIQKYAKKQIKNQNWDYEFTKENYIYLDAVFYMPRKGADADNLYKLLCDSLEKLVYENDSRVLVRTQRILYDKEDPRVEVRFSPVEYIGVFDNQDELDEFESRCQSCSRYLNGRCSILNQAKEGRIQNEITNNICKSYIKKK